MRPVTSSCCSVLLVGDALAASSLQHGVCGSLRVMAATDEFVWFVKSKKLGVERVKLWRGSSSGAPLTLAVGTPSLLLRGHQRWRVEL